MKHLEGVNVRYATFTAGLFYLDPFLRRVGPCYYSLCWRCSLSAWIEVLHCKRLLEVIDEASRQGQEL